MTLRPTLITFLLILIVSPRVFAQSPAISPDWTLPDHAGNPVHLAALIDDRPTLLFFWATWCPYCKALLPHLQSLRFEYGNDINIVAISIRDDDGDPLAYLQNGGFEFTTILNGDEIASKNDVYGTPGVLILNPDREVAFNLYRLPKVEPPDRGGKSGHGRKAAYKAPFWAAEIRKSLDRLLVESYPGVTNDPA